MFMMFNLFYGDWTILILIPAMILTIWAQISVNSNFKKYSGVHTSGGMTGAEAARRILDSNGLYDVRIEHINGSLNDHYDPRENVIRLSDTVYDVPSVAAVGVAAHEAGHAVQYARNYFPIKVRSAIIPATRFGSALAMPIFIIGLIFASDYLLFAGIVLYSLVTLFQLVTLPVEFNASARAMKTLSSSGILLGDELGGARRVLTAAAMTYVAALATSLLSLLRLIIIAGGRSNRRR